MQTAAVIYIGGHGFSRWVLFLYPVYLLAFLAGSRLTLRAAREQFRRRAVNFEEIQKAVIVGAGDTADLMLRELDRSVTLGFRIVALVDDDPKKVGRFLRNVPVYGPVDRLPDLCRELGADMIILAIPRLSGPALLRIVRLCEESGLPLRRVPILSELLDRNPSVLQLREVAPEELLSRPPHAMERDRIRQAVQGKRVLITGGAGSIGTELARQVASGSPAELILLDQAESPLAQLLLEIKKTHPEVPVRPVVADITRSDRLRAWFEQLKPQLVYHAAAYKHVPLMEEFPVEAIENNVIGTSNVADAAEAVGVERFILISTDKAVRPESTMGMTKRLAEAVVLGRRTSRTLFVVVRFGNVLESSGSVIRLFKAQIQNNQALTLTDESATRYFILPSEAAQLVILAGAMAREPEIYLLDMGDPVNMGEMARNLVRLSGRRVDQDVPIEKIGLRPGERLHEPLVDSRESTGPSEAPGIFRVSVNGAAELLNDPRFGELLRSMHDLPIDEVRSRLRSLTTSRDAAPISSA
jgi:FlaA1/EpsC-like NDP-sugar epimerase